MLASVVTIIQTKRIRIERRTHRFFDWCGVVETMAEQDVDMVQLQTFQAGLDTIENVLAVQPMLIDNANVFGGLA